MMQPDSVRTEGIDLPLNCGDNQLQLAGGCVAPSVGFPGIAHPRAAVSKLLLCALGAMSAVCALLPSLALAQPISGTFRSFERSWTHLGGTALRNSRVPLPAPPIQTPTWVQNRDRNNALISFVGQAGLAVFAGRTASDGLVFAAGRIATQPIPPNPFRLYAFSRNDGSVRWQSPIESPASDSFSSPTLDENNGTVIYCSGYRVQAFSIATGEPLWTRELDSQVVNASPLVTSDLWPANRLFITDYAGLNPIVEASVYCINVDPFHESLNPYQPGDLVWSTCIGSSSGNSVSYLPRSLGGEGLVFVATATGQPGTTPGQIRAYSAASTLPEPDAIWTHVNEIPQGYFGGVCVLPASAEMPADSPPCLYAASYAFYGGTDTANLVKLNAHTGALIWSVASNRTSSIPVPLPGGFIALSGGINYLSNTPSVQMFQDLDGSAELIWETAPFFPGAGGWTNQPVSALFGGQNLLAAGSASIDPNRPTAPSRDLYLFNLACDPFQPCFLVRHYVGVGGSPAIVGGSLYCVGMIGLAAFGTTPASLDVDGNGRIEIGDLYAWERGLGNRDVNRDNVVNALDRSDLITILRGDEVFSMKGGL